MQTVKQFRQLHVAPNVGLEPTTPGLRVPSRPVPSLSLLFLYFHLVTLFLWVFLLSLSARGLMRESLVSLMVCEVGGRDDHNFDRLLSHQSEF